MLPVWFKYVILSLICVTLEDKPVGVLYLLVDVGQSFLSCSMKCYIHIENFLLLKMFLRKSCANIVSKCN